MFLVIELQQLLSVNNPLVILLFLCMLITVLSIIALGSVRLYFLRNACPIIQAKKLIKQPMVSIHLPICNEPPELVRKTIQSIAKLTYTNFELLVISNNTVNSELWHPVRDQINTLDDRFKFYHIEQIKGYKAGALNYALAKTAVHTSYLFTLDADYVLKPQALEIAIGTIEKTAVDVLQFPQAYRNVSDETLGMELNYKHYFDCYLSCRQSHTMALPTGTLTVIKKEVFDEKFKWPTDSITEDASLGVELVEMNKKISFCNRIIGHGTMPTASRDYKKQFERWVFGNFQVLHKVWRSSNISFKKKIHLSTLLTAWLNLLGVIFILMTFTLPFLFYKIPAAEVILALGFVGVLAHGSFQYIIFNKISKSKTLRSWRGFLIHLGLLEIGAFYWMHYFIKRDKPFVRTNKFLSCKTYANRFYFLPLGFLVASVLFFWLQYFVLASCAFLLTLQLGYAKYHKDHELVWSKFNLYKKG